MADMRCSRRERVRKGKSRRQAMQRALFNRPGALRSTS